MIHTAMQVAKVMQSRSEDPWTKVGCVAMTSDNRIIATSYNGLMPGFKWKDLISHLWTNYEVKVGGVPYSFEDMEARCRNNRLPFMVHAEQNLCSLIRRNEAQILVTTVCPCSSCILLIAAHGIRTVIYDQEYDRDPLAHEIAKFYRLNLERLQ